MSQSLTSDHRAPVVQPTGIYWWTLPPMPLFAQNTMTAVSHTLLTIEGWHRGDRRERREEPICAAQQ